MKDLWLSWKLWRLWVGKSARKVWPQTYNDHCIIRAEKETSDASKLVRSCKAEKLAENNVFEETEGLLYAPGMAD